MLASCRGGGSLRWHPRALPGPAHADSRTSPRLKSSNRSCAPGAARSAHRKLAPRAPRGTPGGPTPGGSCRDESSTYVARSSEIARAVCESACARRLAPRVRASGPGPEEGDQMVLPGFSAPQTPLDWKTSAGATSHRARRVPGRFRPCYPLTRASASAKGPQPTELSKVRLVRLRGRPARGSLTATLVLGGHGCPLPATDDIPHPVLRRYMCVSLFRKDPTGPSGDL